VNQPSGTILTEDGMQIDDSDEQSENADFSMRNNRKSASNVTIQRAAHERPPAPSTTSTDEGMQTRSMTWAAGRPLPNPTTLTPKTHPETQIKLRGNRKPSFPLGKHETGLL
jgi:hypothetical protein